ncbi:MULTISPECIES: hypothetical protein [unclassified Streptomyces]|nr:MULTISPECIES: hypothetical protein [unclassified Streptomyces]
MNLPRTHAPYVVDGTLAALVLFAVSLRLLVPGPPRGDTVRTL